MPNSPFPTPTRRASPMPASCKGIDVRVMQHALSTPPEMVYVLLPAVLVEYRLVFEGEAE